MNNLKLSSSRLVIEIVGRAMLICGISGYRNDSKFSLGRHLRDAYGAALMVNNDRIMNHNAAHAARAQGGMSAMTRPAQRHPPRRATSLSRTTLLEAGLLIPSGVPGVYGLGGVFEHVIEQFERLVTRMGADLDAEVHALSAAPQPRDLSQDRPPRDVPEPDGLGAHVHRRRHANIAS